MLINCACELKGQFNVGHQWHVCRIMVRIIWEVQISEGQIIRAILYTVTSSQFRYVADIEDDSDKESYTSKKKQKQTQLMQEYNLRPSMFSDEEAKRGNQFVNRPFNTSWQQIQREIIAVTSKRKQEAATEKEYISVCYTL